VNLQIKDVNKENLIPFVKLYIPSDKTKEPSFIKGIEKMKIVKEKILERYGSLAKVVYLDEKVYWIYPIYIRLQMKKLIKNVFGFFY